MKLLHHDYVNELISENSFSFLVIEKERFYMHFFRDLSLALAGEKSKIALLDKGNILNIVKIGDWIEQSWTLSLNEKKLLSKAYGEVQHYLEDNKREQELIQKWYELQDLMQEVLSEKSRLVIPDQFISSEDILKALGAKLSVLSSDLYIERLEDYLLYQIEYGGKRVFIFDQILAYLDYEELTELIAFAEREEVFILAVEAHENDKIKNSSGRYLLVDQDGCEILIRES